MTRGMRPHPGRASGALPHLPFRRGLLAPARALLVPPELGRRETRPRYRRRGTTLQRGGRSLWRLNGGEHRCEQCGGGGGCQTARTRC
jgi:hypothetical protein